MLDDAGDATRTSSAVTPLGRPSTWTVNAPPGTLVPPRSISNATEAVPPSVTRPDAVASVSAPVTAVLASGFVASTLPQPTSATTRPYVHFPIRTTLRGCGADGQQPAKM